MSIPLEPLPIYYHYFPFVCAYVIASVICEAIPLAFFGKKKRGGAKTQRIKPGVQYQWDPNSSSWVPVIKHPPSTVQYKSVSPPVTKANDPNIASISLQWPLDVGFIVTQDFQQHLRTKIEKGYKYYNGGLDLAFPDILVGAPVTASAAGILKSASFSGEGYGNVVYLDHLNGFLTIYAHLCAFSSLIPGHAVEAGDVIGYLGHSGNCWGGPGNPDGTHLHFELRYLNTPVDPLPYLS